MVSWCCRVFVPLTGLLMVISFFIFPILPVLIAGCVLLGLAILNEVLYWVFRAKAGVTKKDAGFPDKRNIVFRIFLLLYAAIGTVLIAWPIGYVLQLIFTFTIGLFLPEKTRLTVCLFRLRG